MIQALQYTIEAGIVFAVFQRFFSQAYYSLCYNKWNRIFLIVSTAASYALPLMKKKYPYQESTGQDFKILDVATENGLDFITISREKTLSAEISDFLDSALFETIVETLFAVYAAGVAVNLFVFLRGLFKTLRLRRNPVVSVLDGGIKVYKTELDTIAFSFFKSVFIGRKAEKLSERDLETVFSHERQHIKGFHTFDALIFGLFRIFQWFNPFVKKAAAFSKSVCENIADCNASKETGLTNYTELVLSLGEKQTMPEQKTHSRSHIAERLLLLLSPEKDKIRKIRFCFSTAVLSVAVAAYVLLAGVFSKDDGRIPLPLKGEYTVSAEYFENLFYADREGGIFEVSHPQTDICVKGKAEVFAPEGFSLGKTKDGEITLTSSDTVVVFGGFNGTDTLMYIKATIGGRIVNPKKIFKL